MLRFLAKRAGWGFPGSTIVSGGAPKGFEPSRIVRIVEADGAQITSLNVAPVEDSEFFEVTFKVNTEEIESLFPPCAGTNTPCRASTTPRRWRTKCARV